MNKPFDPRSASAEDAVPLLQELIAIPSQFSEPSNSEHDEICASLEAKYLVMGATVKILRPEPGYPVLVASFGPEDGKPVIAFLNHYHTVPINNRDRWNHDPFAGEIDDGKLYGRGACDCKDGIAASMVATAMALGTGKRFKGRMIHLVVPGEGAHVKSHPNLVKHFADEVRADYYIDGDGAFELRTKIGGFIWLKLKTKGRSGHCATYLPDGTAPINANAKMVKVLNSVLDVDSWMTYVEDPLFGPPRRYSTKPIIEVGILNGGTKVNIVADECVAHLDIRMLPSQKPDTVMAELGALLDKLGAADPELKTEIEIIGIQKPPFDLPENDAVVGAIRRAAKVHLGRELEDIGHVGSGKPALMQLGLLIYFGAGNGGNEHGYDEYIPTKDLVTCTRIYADLIEDVLME